jgi:hypothetical protein
MSYDAVREGFRNAGDGTSIPNRQRGSTPDHLTREYLSRTPGSCLSAHTISSASAGEAFVRRKARLLLSPLTENTPMKSAPMTM